MSHPPTLACDVLQGLCNLAQAASLAQLHLLDLSHNDLGQKAAEGLQQLLSGLHNLQHLNLSNTAVGGQGETATYSSAAVPLLLRV